MKVKIVDIHKTSAHYEDRERLVGKTVRVDGRLTRGAVRGWKQGALITEQKEWIYCCAMKVEPVE